MAEVLTRKIANEYKNMAGLLPPDGPQDIGDRRKLRIELQVRYNLTELEAINIINGYHIGDYVVLAERRERERKKREKEE